MTNWRPYHGDASRLMTLALALRPTEGGRNARSTPHAGGMYDKRS